MTTDPVNDDNLETTTPKATRRAVVHGPGGGLSSVWLRLERGQRLDCSV